MTPPWTWCEKQLSDWGFMVWKCLFPTVTGFYFIINVGLVSDYILFGKEHV